VSESQLKPTFLRREGDGLVIDWSDGIRTSVSWKVLRANCPCASCIEERSKPPNPLRILSAQEVAAGDPSPVKMLPRGYYAYQIVWNDGHDTGIYPLELLRQLSATTGAAGA
jgi:DUF971 family protein